MSIFFTSELLVSKNKSAYRFARDIGSSDNVISQILKGRQCPRLAMARRIAYTLGLSLDDLMFLAEIKDQSTDTDTDNQSTV